MTPARAAAFAPRRNILAVVAWMSGTLLSFSAVAVAIRELSGALSVFEILALRNIAGIVILLALALVRPSLRAGFVPR
ncbi:MAG TPA: hypothetical protein VLQ65_14115, partial [Saliniramus sp.]|nr:hypothetical protein [Saliniramus sp.]